MRNRYRNGLLVLLLSTPSAILAGDSGLAGLDTLGVVGSVAMHGKLDDTASELSTQLKNDALLMLRLAGIVADERHYTSSVVNRSSHYSYTPPIMEIDVQVFSDEEDVDRYVFDVHVALVQPVATDRGERVDAATWDAGAAGVTGKDELAATVRHRVKNLVELFLNAYRAENGQQEPE